MSGTINSSDNNFFILNSSKYNRKRFDFLKKKYYINGMVQLIKLITGELVIADVIENQNGPLTLKNPMTIVLSDRGLGMAPLAPFIEGDKLEITNDKIIFRGKADPEIVNPYNAKFGSGIVTAPAGVIDKL